MMGNYPPGRSVTGGRSSDVPGAWGRNLGPGCVFQCCWQERQDEGVRLGKWGSGEDAGWPLVSARGLWAREPVIHRPPLGFVSLPMRREVSSWCQHGGPEPARVGWGVVRGPQLCFYCPEKLCKVGRLPGSGVQKVGFGPMGLSETLSIQKLGGLKVGSCWSQESFVVCSGCWRRTCHPWDSQAHRSPIGRWCLVTLAQKMADTPSQEFSFFPFFSF